LKNEKTIVNVNFEIIRRKPPQVTVGPLVNTAQYVLKLWMEETTFKTVG
jgi:hypothetical protein